jgi:hypothetical protein
VNSNVNLEDEICSEEQYQPTTAKLLTYVLYYYYAIGALIAYVAIIKPLISAVVGSQSVTANAKYTSEYENVDAKPFAGGDCANAWKIK